MNLLHHGAVVLGAFFKSSDPEQPTTTQTVTLTPEPGLPYYNEQHWVLSDSLTSGPGRAEQTLHIWAGS